MAQIKFTCKNSTTGKVSYSCVKMTGTYEECYEKLLSLANRILQEYRHTYQMYIYNYVSVHWWHTRRFNRLLCAYGKPYFMYSDEAYSYYYSITK